MIMKLLMRENKKIKKHFKNNMENMVKLAYLYFVERKVSSGFEKVRNKTKYVNLCAQIKLAHQFFIIRLKIVMMHFRTLRRQHQLHHCPMSLYQAVKSAKPSLIQ